MKPADRSQGWARAAAKPSPRPPQPPGRKGACMGSHPTLDQTERAAEARQLDPDDWSHGHAVAHLAADHPQVRAWPDDNPDLAHHLDHRDRTDDHSHPSLELAAEQAFDRLN